MYRITFISIAQLLLLIYTVVGCTTHGSHELGKCISPRVVVLSRIQIVEDSLYPILSTHFCEARSGRLLISDYVGAVAHVIDIATGKNLFTISHHYSILDSLWFQAKERLPYESFPFRETEEELDRKGFTTDVLNDEMMRPRIQSARFESDTTVIVGGKISPLFNRIRDTVHFNVDYLASVNLTTRTSTKFRLLEWNKARTDVYVGTTQLLLHGDKAYVSEYDSAHYFENEKGTRAPFMSIYTLDGRRLGILGYLDFLTTQVSGNAFQTNQLIPLSTTELLFTSSIVPKLCIYDENLNLKEELSYLPIITSVGIKPQLNEIDFSVQQSPLSKDKSPPNNYLCTTFIPVGNQFGAVIHDRVASKQKNKQISYIVLGTIEDKNVAPCWSSSAEYGRFRPLSFVDSFPRSSSSFKVVEFDQETETYVLTTYSIHAE